MCTIDELEKSFTVIYNSPQCETIDAFIWFFGLSDEFLTLLKERTQESLVIFAYSCVLFRILLVDGGVGCSFDLADLESSG